MHFHRFSKSEDARILELYAGGRSYLQIGQRQGRSQQVIYHRLVRLGAVTPQRQRRLAAETRALIDKLVAEGLTGYSIAKSTGLPSATVYGYMERSGIKSS